MGAVINLRLDDEVMGMVETFRDAQFVLPSKVAALRVLVRLGFEKWQETEKARPPKRRGEG